MTHASEFNAGLLDFLARSPTPFHATANLAALLTVAGFEALAAVDATSSINWLRPVVVEPAVMAVKSYCLPISVRTSAALDWIS